MIEVTLPWPPSVNSYWRSFNGRAILSEKGRQYREAVADQVLIQRAAKHFEKPLRVEIEAFRPDRRRRDLDNLLKAVLDGLAQAHRVGIVGGHRLALHREPGLLAREAAVGRRDAPREQGAELVEPGEVAPAAQMML